MFFEHKGLYPMKGPVAEAEYTVPFGQAEIKRKGKDVTIVATAMMLQKSLKAAKQLEAEGIEVEIVDPRTLVPLDKKTILDSVRKTSRLVIVDEDYERCGFASEIAAIVADEAFDVLDEPIKRVSTPNVPIPFAPVLENAVIPSEQRIVETVRDLVGEK
jgi:pyruvate/2-oxoglutarate/acetoin dehydrogenase E1 component